MHVKNSLNMTGILNKQERVEIRKRIFLHLDGWALIPSIYALHKLDILSHFLEKINGVYMI